MFAARRTGTVAGRSINRRGPLTERQGKRLYSQGMPGTFSRFLRDESGATSIEYGLIASLVALVIISALKGIGTKLNNKFQAVSNSLS